MKDKNINIQKLVVFSHTGNKYLTRNLKKTTTTAPLTTALGKIEYLGTDLTNKEVKDLYTKTYTTLLKKLNKTQIERLLVFTNKKT